VVESSERGSKPVTGRNLRPRSIGHVWAWIIIATCSVIFLSITMWVVSVGRTTSDALADKEVVHRLAERMIERWPQVPGPSSLYESQAQEAMESGDSVEAARRSSMALALDPNAEQSWIRLIVASSQPGFGEPMLSQVESESILDAIEGVSGSSFDLQVARAWLALKRGDVPGTPLVSEGEKETLAYSLLRLRMLGDSADMEAVEAVLRHAPGHVPSCAKRVVMARTGGDLKAEKEWTNRCLSAGVDIDVMKSNGETLDSTTVSP